MISEVVVDNIKDDLDVDVFMDIIFPKFPCSAISLDKHDSVKSHTLDVSEQLLKLRLSGKKDNFNIQDDISQLSF